jgi:hypothetical protein
VLASMQPLMIYPRDEWKGMEGIWQQYPGSKFLPRAFAIRSLLDTHVVLTIVDGKIAYETARSSTKGTD